MIARSNIANVVTAFERQVDAAPDAVAIQWQGGQWTYAQLHEIAQRLASKIRKRVPAGCLVGIYDEATPSFIAAMLGVMSAGCSYIAFDNDLATKPKRLMEILHLTDCKALLVRTDYLTVLKEFPNQGWTIKKFDAHFCLSCHGGYDETRERPAWRDQVVGPIANVTFTSGSGGLPKAVLIPHRAILNHVDSWQVLLDHEPRRRHLLMSTLAFSLSMSPVYQSLLTGGALVLPPHGWGNNFRVLIDAIDAFKVTSIKTVPSALRNIVQSAQHHSNLRSLTSVTLSGEQTHWSHIYAWQKSYPNVRLFITYGLTEAFSFTAYEIPSESDSPADNLPIGTPTLGNSVMVLDSRGHECSADQRGQLFVRGNGESAGYLRAGTFVPMTKHFKDLHDPGVIATGDIGYRDATGRLYFVGRQDLMVKNRGFRVDPEEIERHLIASQLVMEAGVYKDEESESLMCVCTASEPLLLRSLRDYLEEHLWPHLIPSKFIQANTLPKLASGKIDRAQLPMVKGVVLTLRNTAPDRSTMTETQRMVYDTWAEALDTQMFGLDDSFEDAGGDSLMYLEMILDLEALFNVDIVEAMPHCSVRSLAILIDRKFRTRPETEVDDADGVSLTGVIPVKHMDHIQPTRIYTDIRELTSLDRFALACSQRRRFKNRDNAQFSTTYMRIRFLEPPDHKALCMTLSHLVNHLPVLRRTIDTATLEQVNHRLVGDAQLPSLDLSSQSPDEIMRQINSIPFMKIDNGEWPAFRWVLIRQPDCHEFIWQLSHNLIDLIGVDLLTERFIAVYSQFAKGNAHIDRRRSHDLLPQLTSELDALVYPPNLLRSIQQQIREYFEAVDQAMGLIRERGFTEESKWTFKQLESCLPKNEDVYHTLAVYTKAFATWLGVTHVPLRVGSSGRRYDALMLSYHGVIAQLNDHDLMMVECDPHTSIDELAWHLRERLIFFRKQSVNFDKILELTEKTNRTLFGPLPWSNLLSFGPLRGLTVNHNETHTIVSIPRPQWGETYFHPLASGTKIGGHSYRDERGTHVHFNIRGFRTESALAFVDCFKKALTE